MPATQPTEALDLLTIQQVADWLHVAKSTVEEWVYGQDLASFKKGGVRKINRADVVRFVLLNTIKPRRPDWLTAPLEAEFKGLLTRMIQAEVRAAINAAVPGSAFQVSGSTKVAA